MYVGTPHCTSVRVNLRAGASHSRHQASPLFPVICKLSITVWVCRCVCRCKCINSVRISLRIHFILRLTYIILSDMY